MPYFDTKVMITTNARISSYDVACIIERARENMLGGKDRFIKDGNIHEEDTVIRLATAEEMKHNDALLVAESFFLTLKY